MRSPLVPLAVGALTVVVVAASALLWAMFLRAPDPGPAAEVVVGESPESATAEPADDDLVDPPPPVSDQGGEGNSGSPSPETSPEPDPGPTGFPFDCLDENVNHEAWGEDQWDDWWDDCLDARYENGDDDDD